MCNRKVEGSTADCAFKTHDLKCPKGHPLHISVGLTFLCCRSGCSFITFIDAENIEQVKKQFKISNVIKA